METIAIISTEHIKPSSPTIFHQKPPHKLSLLDQLTPSFLIPVIIFYSINESNFDQTINTLVTKAKSSLSETLNFFYPYSGKIKDNILIHHFESGVPFQEAQVNCTMSKFLENPTMESLNQLLPYQLFSRDHVNEPPLMAIQFNKFSSDGFAAGLCMNHKIGDAATDYFFCYTWCAIMRGSCHEAIQLNLDKASSIFPPKNPMPQKYALVRDNLWLPEGNCVTKRFLFDNKAIAMLRQKAKGESQALPSRVEALSAFIWKCFIAASKGASNGIQRSSILGLAINLRPRTTQSMLNDAFGNLFWNSIAVTEPDTTMELHQLRSLISESIAKIDNEYIKSLQGEEGFCAISERLDLLENMVSLQNPDFLVVTSWCNIGVDQLNAGVGEPVWFAVGTAGAPFMNRVGFLNGKWCKGIEAWVTLEEKRMALLEHDPQLIAYTSPSPSTKL